MRNAKVNGINSINKMGENPKTVRGRSLALEIKMAGNHSEFFNHAGGTRGAGSVNHHYWP